MANNEYISQLSPYLFWDMDRNQLDAEIHSRSLIARVLEYGQMKDWTLTRQFYGMDRIVAECKQMRSLDPVALAFICAISDSKKEEFRCYQFAQSFPTRWNS